MEDRAPADYEYHLLSHGYGSPWDTLIREFRPRDLERYSNGKWEEAQWAHEYLTHFSNDACSVEITLEEAEAFIADGSVPSRLTAPTVPWWRDGTATSPAAAEPPAASDDP